jgi:hypothetical protein
MEGCTNAPIAEQEKKVHLFARRWAVIAVIKGRFMSRCRDGLAPTTLAQGLRLVNPSIRKHVLNNTYSPDL